MALIDASRAVLLVYPEVESVDTYGNTLRGPADVPVAVSAQVQRSTSSERASQGQVSRTSVKVWARSLPTGPWGRVEWAGRSWDVEGEVERRRDGSPATWHDCVYLRARDAGALT